LSNIAETEKKTGHDLAIHSDLAIRYLIAAHMLIERVRAKYSLVVTPLNVHRLVITALVLASKILDDVQPSMYYFAVLGGLPQEELSRLEVAFLSLLDYDVQIDPLVFRAKYELLLESKRAFSDFGMDSIPQDVWASLMSEV